MQINEYLYTATVVENTDFLDLDKDMGAGVFQSQKLPPDVLLSYITDNMPDDVNIYNSDGTVTGNRTVNLNTNKLIFADGNLYLATIGVTGGAFRLEVSKSGAGGAIYASTGGVAGEFHGSGTAGAFFSASGLGIFSVATRNVFRDDGSASVPSAVPGSMLEMMSSGQGVRVFPRMTQSNRNSIASPPDGVVVHNTDIEYPDMYHPLYGWQSLGYGVIRILFDFSLNPYTGVSFLINTKIPQGSVIHKMVAVGEDVDDSNSPVTIFLGMESQDDYFITNDSNVNSLTGDVSMGNSNRTLAPNENLSFYASDSISSGKLKVTIYHT